MHNDKDRFPTLDYSEMDSAAVGLNEIYRSLRKGGFKRYEALYIIAAIMSGGPNLEEGSDKG